MNPEGQNPKFRNKMNPDIQIRSFNQNPNKILKKKGKN